MQKNGKFDILENWKLQKIKNEKKLKILENWKIEKDFRKN